jgi:aldehyde:ferredoxin oxidoreductase
MKGYAGRILRVDLTNSRVATEPLSMEDVMDFIGGRGFGIKYLYEELPPNIDPLGEDNKLLLLTGVLTGTSAQATSRWFACTKSPLTGCYARSCAGGDFGAWMKFAGYDFIIIEGKAEKPVYLYVTADGGKIEDAHELWGKDTQQTQEWLYQRYGRDTRIACIGPAGENLVKYAAILAGKRTAGRCGVGTVMGSKHLKAVAVKAKRNLYLHDPEGFRQLVKDQVNTIQGSKDYQRHRDEGTTDGVVSRNLLGVFPVRNFRYGQLNGYEQLSVEAYRKLRVRNSGCYSCSARCGKTHVIPAGPYAGARSEGPDYESMWAFSGSVDSNNIEATVAADQLCDDLGLDTISTGNSIGFAYELYEKGILTMDDTDGLELTYGNHDAMVTLIKRIGRREGLGDILAEGTLRAARYIGKEAEAYAMQVKGLELPGYEPRARAVDRFAEEGKADIVIYNQNHAALREVGVVCIFAGSWGDWYRRLFNRMLFAATGIEEFADWDYLHKAGERIWNLDRAFNVRDGFNRRHDTLPRRFLSEPLHTKEAPGENQMIRTLDKFLDEYYQLRGWTEEGIPSRQKLEELGLGYVVKDIAALQ